MDILVSISSTLAPSAPFSADPSPTSLSSPSSDPADNLYSSSLFHSICASFFRELYRHRALAVLAPLRRHPLLALSSLVELLLQTLLSAEIRQLCSS
jgi:hypothetical protein